MSQRLLTVLTVALMFIGSAGLVGCEAGGLVGEVGDLLPGEYGAKAKQAERVAREAEDVQEEADDLGLFADSSDEGDASVSRTTNTSVASEFTTDEAAVEALQSEGWQGSLSQFRRGKEHFNTMRERRDQPTLTDPHLRAELVKAARKNIAEQ